MNTEESPFFSGAVRYWWSFCLITGISVVGFALSDTLGYRTIGFLFLTGVFAVGSFNTVGPVLFAAGLSALVWNFVFIPPRFTFAISATEDLLLCVGYFLAAVVTGALTSRSRQHEQRAREREERAQFLYEILKDILEFSRPKDFLSRIAIRIEEHCGGECVFVLNDENPPARSAEYQVFGVRGRKEQTARMFFKGWLGADQRELLELVCQQIGLTLERTHLERRLRDTERLEESERLHQTLFNSVSHELRTPLTALMGFASALEDESASSPEFRSKITAGLQDAAGRMNRVIGNLLDMSRLSSNAMVLKKEWHDPSDLIGVTLNALNSPRQITARVPAELPLVEMDFRLMEIALANLLVNALNYSDAPVEIEVLAGDASLRFAVRDEGTGISEKYLARIFEKFYRVPGTPTGGTGLGLSIVKNIVDLHRGEVSVANRPRRGAEFVITLPLGQPPALPEENDRE